MAARLLAGGRHGGRPSPCWAALRSAAGPALRAEAVEESAIANAAQSTSAARERASGRNPRARFWGMPGCRRRRRPSAGVGRAWTLQRVPPAQDLRPWAPTNYWASRWLSGPRQEGVRGRPRLLRERGGPRAGRGRPLQRLGRLLGGARVELDQQMHDDLLVVVLVEAHMGEELAHAGVAEGAVGEELDRLRAEQVSTRSWSTLTVEEATQGVPATIRSQRSSIGTTRSRTGPPDRGRDPGYGRSLCE